MRSVVVPVVTAAVLLVGPAAAAQAAPADPRPPAPASLTVGGIACTAGGILVGTTTPRITASVTGPGTGRSGSLTPTFAVWPVGAPAQRAEWNPPAVSPPSTVFTNLPAPVVNGGRYRLVARVTDPAGTSSAWSPVCTFTVDTIRPHAPVVTSTEYPENRNSGGVGVPGTFTIAVAGDDRDVTGFRYSFGSGGLGSVPVGPGGRSTIEFTPSRFGTDTLTVQAIDRTLNRSAETTYSFDVIDHNPKVIQDDRGTGVNEPRAVRFWSAVPGTASFTYRLNDGPPQTVTADADGSAAATVTPDRRGDNFLVVSSRTATGVVSPQVTVNLYVQVQVPEPVITSPDFPGDGTPPPSAGQEVTIVLHTGSPEVDAFVWSADFGETEQTVAAGPDGTATVRFTTPDWALILEVQARARTRDGFTSATTTTAWDLTPAEAGAPVA